jgi:hypothetical protein
MQVIIHIFALFIKISYIPFSCLALISANLTQKNLFL